MFGMIYILYVQTELGLPFTDFCAFCMLKLVIKSIIIIFKK